MNEKDRVVRTTIEPYRRPPLILSLVYAHGQNVARNGRTWRREGERRGEELVKPPNQPVKSSSFVSRSPPSSPFFFSCDFKKHISLLKRACVRSPFTNAPTPIPFFLFFKEKRALLPFCFLLLILLRDYGCWRHRCVSSPLFGFIFLRFLFGRRNGSKEIWQRRASYTALVLYSAKFLTRNTLAGESV